MKKHNINSKNDKKKFFILIAIFVGLIIVSFWLFPFFKELTNEDTRNQLIDYIRGQGFLGVLMLLGLQILQVVVAFIPGELVEIIAGVLYGTWWGYVICTVGVILSSMLVFFMVKKLGYEFVSKNFSDEKLHKFKFLQDSKKLETVIFILFFIPGTPKDMLTYIIPFTKMKPVSFFVISAVARIPSIISSTYAGASLSNGDFAKSIWVFVITGVLGILGIVFKEKILGFVHKLKK